jgi:hypothetical protein
VDTGGVGGLLTGVSGVELAGVVDAGADCSEGCAGVEIGGDWPVSGLLPKSFESIDMYDFLYDYL